MSVERAFDELRFGPQRTLNLRDGLPTAEQAAQRAESWLRERQVAKAGEVLVITGRGSNSEGGVAAVRDALVKLFFSLRRRGVISGTQEHTAGSFVVTLAPVAALFAAPRRHRHPMEQFAPDPTSLAGLGDETRALLRELAVRTLQSLGAQSAAKRFIQDEMRRQFAALSAAVPDGPERERRLRDAVRSAIAELDETFDD
jgi:hypothetical protein